jgi:nucleotide-binding universal stress UspA family protein
MRRQLDGICDTFAAEGIAARAHVYVGNPEQEIEKAARECQATLIVMGSSAKAGWVERWLGSIPRTIAEKSVYPTLLIPPEKL